MTEECEEAPRVTNVGQLQCVGNTSTVDGASLGDNYTMTEDIEASNTSGWYEGDDGFRPIGNNSADDFNGSFDGAGNNITGLTIDRSSEDRT